MMLSIIQSGRTKISSARQMAKQCAVMVPIRCLAPSCSGRLIIGNNIQQYTSRYFVSITRAVQESSDKTSTSSPFDPNPEKKSLDPTNKRLKKIREFIPRKAAVQLTDQARTFFKQLLENPPRPEVIGIMLSYHQSMTGEPRMVFSFNFVTADDVGPDDEGVSLEVLSDGKPKPPADSLHDGLPKLYVNHDAFLKVLGATVDINKEEMMPVLYDSEGNKMDPNA